MIMSPAEQLEQFCEKYGYGFTMGEASRLWFAKDKIGAISTGPCYGSLVKCGCHGGCDWCMGTGLLTKKVKEIKDKMTAKTTKLIDTTKLQIVLLDNFMQQLGYNMVDQSHITRGFKYCGTGYSSHYISMSDALRLYNGVYRTVSVNNQTCNLLELGHLGIDGKLYYKALASKYVTSLSLQRERNGTVTVVGVASHYLQFTDKGLTTDKIYDLIKDAYGKVSLEWRLLLDPLREELKVQYLEV